MATFSLWLLAWGRSQRLQGFWIPPWWEKHQRTSKGASSRCVGESSHAWGCIRGSSFWSDPSTGCDMAKGFHPPSHTMQRLVYVWWFIVKLFHLLSSLSSCYQNLEISISQHVTAVSARRSRWSKAVLEIAGWWLQLLLLLVTLSLSRSSSIPTIWQRMVSRHHYFSLPKINENQDLPTFLVVMSDVKDVSMFMDLRSGVLIARQVCCFNVRCRDALMDSACHWWVHSMQTTKWKTCSSLRKTYGPRTMGSFARVTHLNLHLFLWQDVSPVWNQSTTISLFGHIRPSFFVFALVTSRKAFGKFVYSWGKLEGGDAWYAFQVMTGFKTCVAYTMRKNKWKKKTLKEDWAHGKTENARGRKINYKCVSPWCAVLLKLWASLQKAERNRHLSTVGETIFGQMPRFQLWLWAKRAGKVIWTEICNPNLILFGAGLTSPKALIPKNWNDFKRKKLLADPSGAKTQDVNELFEELHRLGTKDYLMSCSCQGANAEAKAFPCAFAACNIDLFAQIKSTWFLWLREHCIAYLKAPLIVSGDRNHHL